MKYPLPLLFIMYMDMVIREVATTQEHHNYILAYADDIAQTAASEGELADMMNVWQAAFNKYHLKLNLLKTEVKTMGRSHQTLNIIGDHTLNQVQSFKYLGTSLEIHFFGGSKRLLPGARPGGKTNFVVAKLFVHFLRNDNIMIL